MTSPVRALTRFHLRAGARVALRANAALLGTVTFIFGQAPAPDALLTFERFMIGIVSRSATSGPRMLFAAISTALGATAVPRVMLGTSGWMRSLPVDARTRRRAAVAAITAAQAIVAIALVVFAIIVHVVLHDPLDWPRIIGVPVMMVAIAGTLLPRQPILMRALDAIAIAAAIRGTGWAVGVALILVLISNSLQPPVAAPNVPKPAPTPTALAARRVRSPRALWLRATWRAIGMRRMVDAALAAAIPCAFAYLITRNNPQLPIATVERVARICCAIGLVFFAATATNALLASRPPWSWARSLPWSALDRVIIDAIVLGAPLIVVVAAVAPVHWPSALLMLCVVPFVGALCAGALRGAATKQFGAAGLCLVIGIPAGVAVAIWPMLAVLVLACTPVLLRWAAARERDSRATRFAELRHSAAGDPMWISRA